MYKLEDEFLESTVYTIYTLKEKIKIIFLFLSLQSIDQMF